MLIGNVATVRTGLVTARKKTTEWYIGCYEYKALNLKCIFQDGNIITENLETYIVAEYLKEDYLTQMGDILVRLSSPYTVVIINKIELCGLVIPSHFAIIRVNRSQLVPEYLFWSLRRDKNKIILMQNSSGGTAFATISSGLIANLEITVLPIEKQRTIGMLAILVEREQALQYKMAEEKKKYNSALLNKIYKEIKRGNIL